MGLSNIVFLPMKLAAKLIALRKDRGLTQQQMADLIGVHVNQVKRYEAGTSQPSLDALKRIAVAFSVTTDSLLFEDHERAPSEDLTLEFEAVSQMPPEERRVIRDVLSGLILRYQAGRWSQTRARQ